MEKFQVNGWMIETALLEKRREVSSAVKNAEYFDFLRAFTIENQVMGIVARGKETNAGETRGTESWTNTETRMVTQALGCLKDGRADIRRRIRVVLRDFTDDLFEISDGDRVEGDGLHA
jgi:hypothetical protein